MELFIERTRNRGIAGNIYKGRVRKILPGMQSAFVDIGLEKDAFLYVADVAAPVGADDKWAPGDSSVVEELEADARYYKGLWDSIGGRIATSTAPALVHAELGLLDKLLRDVVAGEFVEILLDTEVGFQTCVERLSRVQPELAARVARH